MSLEMIHKIIVVARIHWTDISQLLLCCRCGVWTLDFFIFCNGLIYSFNFAQTAFDFVVVFMVPFKAFLVTRLTAGAPPAWHQLTDFQPIFASFTELDEFRILIWTPGRMTTIIGGLLDLGPNVLDILSIFNIKYMVRGC